MTDSDGARTPGAAAPTENGCTHRWRDWSLFSIPGVLLTFLWILTSAPWCRAGVVDAEIRVHCGAVGAPVNGRLLGQNVPVSISGLWDSAADGIHSASEAAVRGIRPSVLRFPGGSMADLYLWEDGISQRARDTVGAGASEIHLKEAPGWRSGNGARFLGPSAGRYGDPFQFLRADGQTLRWVRGMERPHPPDAPVRLDRRNGQPDWLNNALGSPEIIKLAESLGSELLLTVNFGTGIDGSGSLSVAASLDQRVMRAAAWVAYMNGSVSDERPIGIDPEGNDWRTVSHWARQRVEEGRSAPVGVRHWEVGNELFYASEAGHTTAEEYARGFVRFVRAMKAMDPSIKVGAAGMSDPAGRGDLDSLVPWNATLIRLAKADMDFLAVHPYYPSALRSQITYGGEDWFRGVMAGASQAAAHLEGIRGELDRTEPVGKGVEIVVSEYGIWPADSRDARDYSNLARAAHDTDLLIQLLRAGERWGVTLATGWNLQSSTETALIRHDWTTGLGTRRPQYHAFQMLRGLDGSRLLPVSIQGPTFGSPKFGNLEARSGIPVLEAAAFVGAQGRVSLLVLNRDLHNVVQASVQLGECPPHGPASARVLAGPAPSAHNEDPSPAVQPLSQPVSVSSRSMVLAFPPHSITLLELDGQGAGGTERPIPAPRDIRNIDEG